MNRNPRQEPELSRGNATAHTATLPHEPPAGFDKRLAKLTAAPISLYGRVVEVYLPSGTVTFLFTDVEGSTSLWQQHPEVMRRALSRHDALAEEIVPRHGGVLIKERGEGDSLFAVFSRATDAVAAVLDLQLAFCSEPWPPETPLRVRMALSTGEADDMRDGGYYGIAVNRCVRLRSAAYGGQILCSETTHALVQSDLPPDAGWRDLGIHRLADVGHEHVWQLLHPSLPSEFAALKALDPERHNLPLPPSSFVGHEAEIALWHNLVRDPATRLLTLMGVGGVGKSRAALRIAELCKDDFADGVWWVDLQEARIADAMVGRIAYDLGIALRPGLPVQEQVWAFLRTHALLLVLDNTEQIDDAAATIHELLRVAPSVKCLVTTRRVLGLRAESVVEIEPLTAAEAEALFIERARFHEARFALTPENATDVAELCRRLEGVPLAIELAASRIAGMTPRDMLDRLDDPFRLLQFRAPDLPQRQRAMQATIDWSYALLAGEHQSLLAQLSVFAGGFRLDDAEAVCEGADVFEGVLVLRQDSLLRAKTHGPTRQTRYRMLETIREYAMGKLRESPDGGASICQRHAEHFLGFAEQRGAQIRKREEAQALDELENEYDNLWGALEWAQQGGQDELCARLALALFPLLQRRGLSEGGPLAWAAAQRCLRASQGAALRLGAKGQSLVSAIACRVASLAYGMGDLAEARQQGEACLALRRELGDEAGMAEALNVLACVATEAGDMESARKYASEALSLCAEDNHSQRALILHNLGRLASCRGDIDEARELYGEALRHRRAAGDVPGEAETLGNLGAVAQNANDLKEARRLYRESLALSRTQRYPYGIGVALHNLGELAELAGDCELAAALLTHAERILRELQSADARTAADSLQRVVSELGEDRWMALQTELKGKTWQEIVEGLA